MKRVQAKATFSEAAQRLFSNPDHAREVVQNIVKRAAEFYVTGVRIRRGKRPMTLNDLK